MGVKIHIYGMELASRMGIVMQIILCAQKRTLNEYITIPLGKACTLDKRAFP